MAMIICLDRMWSKQGQRSKTDLEAHMNQLLMPIIHGVRHSRRRKRRPSLEQKRCGGVLRKDGHLTCGGEEDWRLREQMLDGTMRAGGGGNVVARGVGGG